MAGGQTLAEIASKIAEILRKEKTLAQITVKRRDKLQHIFIPNWQSYLEPWATISTDFYLGKFPTIVSHRVLVKIICLLGIITEPISNNLTH